MPSARATVFHDGATHVDVHLKRRAWLAEVQLWRGARWPDLERRWFASARRWVPWFSIERQVLHAVAYGTGSLPVGNEAEALLAEVRAARRRLRWELSE